MAFALSLAACGDNKKPVFEDAMTDAEEVILIDAPPDALMCGVAPNLNCSGTCKDTSTDEANCGACGTACGSGQTCDTGVCCDAGKVNCGGTCVDLTLDNAHCGTCTEVCDTVAGESCMNSTCCGGAQTACPGGQCFDTETNDNHCGDCATVCSNTQSCSSGHCCTDGMIWCGPDVGGACVDPNSDEANCGACAGNGGTVCTNTQTCSTGLCCTNGTQRCGNTCVDVLSDENNCGACAPNQTNGSNGDICTTANPVETCLGGLCCAAGTIKCGNTCVDPQSDEMNCGGCGGVGTAEVCNPGEVCLGGADPSCCGPGQINCGGTCVDPLSDNANCGGCPGAGGVICPGTTPVCSGGQCAASCLAPEFDCSGDCVNRDSDHFNCGACGNACGALEVCNNGTCAATCSGSEVSCNGQCVNTQTDPNHCGAGCGVVCAPANECVAGVCQFQCPIGETLCNGVCRNTQTDELACGSCGAAICTGTCLSGLCCPSGQIRCGNACVNITTDPNNCGACAGTGGADVCAGAEVCKPDGTGGGECCLASQNVCNGVCSNPLTDNSNCGGCGIDCGSGTCDGGICCGAGEQNVGGICCPTGFINCPGVNSAPTCFNPDTTNAHCGMCGNNCPAIGLVCQTGVCVLNCVAPNETTCGLCTDVDTDPDFCGPTCVDCPTGASCVDSNPGTGGGVGAACGPCPTGPAGGCGPVGAKACTNTTTDNNNCGACGTVCNTGAGQSCTDGLCCQANEINCTINGTPRCVDPLSDEAACGGCVATGGDTCTGSETCISGTCGCPFGQISCNGNCVTASVDKLNCGSCGNVCGVGLNVGRPLCLSNGCAATCPAPLVACDGRCINPASDSLNCGACDVTTTGNQACSPTQGCVAGSCQTKIVINQSCVGGSNAGNVCSTNTQCPGGTCTGIYPPKCVGGGPPISVPIDGTPTCTGNIAATAFTFGMCSRTQIDVPASIFTDAFNSKLGPHRPVVNNSACTNTSETAGAQCTNLLDDDGDGFLNDGCPIVNVTGETGAQCLDAVDSDGDNVANDGCPQLTQCGVGGICRGAGTAADPRVCVGGGVGVNGTIGPIAKTQQNMHVGGAFWAFGEIGLDWAKTTIVKQRLYNEGPFAFASSGHRVYEKAFVDGPWSSGGNASMAIDQLLTTKAGCPNPAAGLTLNGGCAVAPWDPLLPAPCGNNSDTTRPGGWDIPVQGIVEFFRNPANNDNKLINLKYDALVNASAPIRLDLPCGNYYLDSIQGNQPLTIVVKGRAGLYIGGAADINVEMIFDVEPTGSIDLFIGGVVNISHQITLGSPAYPRLTRMYIGGSSVIGGGSCNAVSTCASGRCSACPAPSMVGTTPTFLGYGACSGTGTCQGTGGNLDPAIDMSQGGFFNGLLWAGYGGFSTSNAVELYGSLFANRIGASGDLKIHYDNGAAQTVDECPPPPGGNQQCESCRDCGNQPCGANGLCATSCTADNQCCPPLRCDIGGTNRCVL